MKKSFFLFAIVLLTCFTLILPIHAKLNIYFLDVGQGDASIITSPTGEVVLIDSGPSKNVILKHLDNLKIGHIDLVIASHAHADHIAGMDEIIAKYQPRAFVDPGIAHTTKTYEKMINAVIEHDVHYYEGASRKITLGNIELTILPPAEPLISQSELNNNSTVVRLDYKNFSCLYTGDIEKERERELCSRVDSLLDVDILKIPHHGSSSSSTPAFIKTVNPDIAIISCGEENSYGHPHDEVLALYYNLDIDIYRTDQHGTILVQTDGSDYTIQTETNAPRAPPVKIEETKKDVSSEYKYAASKKSKVFHYIDCSSAKKISPGNLVLFKTREEAIASGRRPCKICNP
jgi:beta-lactamase superfamily II metal-dependent hydrolase